MDSNKRVKIAMNLMEATGLTKEALENLDTVQFAMLKQAHAVYLRGQGDVDVCRAIGQASYEDFMNNLVGRDFDSIQNLIDNEKWPIRPSMFDTERYIPKGFREPEGFLVETKDDGEKYVFVNKFPIKENMTDEEGEIFKEALRLNHQGKITLDQLYRVAAYPEMHDSRGFPKPAEPKYEAFDKDWTDAPLPKELFETMTARSAREELSKEDALIWNALRDFKRKLINYDSLRAIVWSQREYLQGGTQPLHELHLKNILITEHENNRKNEDQYIERVYGMLSITEKLKELEDQGYDVGNIIVTEDMQMIEIDYRKLRTKLVVHDSLDITTDGKTTWIKVGNDTVEMPAEIVFKTPMDDYESQVFQEILLHFINGLISVEEVMKCAREPMTYHLPPAHPKLTAFPKSFVEHFSLTDAEKTAVTLNKMVATGQLQQKFEMSEEALKIRDDKIMEYVCGFRSIEQTQEEVFPVMDPKLTPTEKQYILAKWIQNYRDLLDGMKSKGDAVHSPSHYNQYKGLEVIDITEKLCFNLGNAVKYLARAGFKDEDTEIQDLEKALWYTTRQTKANFFFPEFLTIAEVQFLVEQMNYNRGNAVWLICLAGRQGSNDLRVDLEEAMHSIRAEIDRLKRLDS